MLLLYFVLGQVALVSILLVIRAIVLREPDLHQRLRDITEIVFRPLRIEQIREELRRSRSVLDRLLAVATRLKMHLAQRIQLDLAGQHWLLGVFLSSLLVVFFEGESALVLLFNATSRMGNLGVETWAFFCSWVATAWLLITHTLTHAIAHDPDRPARTLRLAKIGALVSGMVVATALAVFLLGRNTSANSAESVEGIIQLSLWVLAVCTGFAAAFAGVGMFAIFGEGYYTRRLERVESQIESYTRHVEALEADLKAQEDAGSGDSTGAAGAAPSGGAAPTPFPSSSASAAAAVLLVLSFAAKSQAGGLQPPVLSTPKSCEILVDVSRSTDDVARRDAVNGVSARLGEILNSGDCAVLRVAMFSGDPYFTLWEYSIPTIPSTPVACQKQAPAGTTTGALAAIYPVFNDAHQIRAAKECQEQAKSVVSRATVGRSQVLRDIQQKLVSIEDGPPVGNCTALVEAVVKATARSRVVMVITDGWSSCSLKASAKSFSVPATSILLFLLVPSKGPVESRANEAQDRTSRLTITFPDSQVAFYTEATPSFWKQLQNR